METITTNPILDFYKVCYACGFLRIPVHRILDLPSRHGKSLTCLRFQGKEPNVLVVTGDTTAQSFRNKIFALYQQNRTDDIDLVIIEDASKIRSKVREDFFAIAAQFASGMVSINQQKMVCEFKTHASVIINTPPFFKHNLEKYLLDAGAGDRFDLTSTGLSAEKKTELDILGILNKSKLINPIELPRPSLDGYEDFALKLIPIAPLKEIAFRFGCKVLGLPETLLSDLSGNIIKDISWEGYWHQQRNYDKPVAPDNKTMEGNL